LESDSHDFAVGEILDAKVTRIKGNKVTYEILGSVKIIKNEPKKARNISEGQTVKVKIVDIAEDGTINKVKCVS